MPSQYVYLPNGDAREVEVSEGFHVVTNVGIHDEILISIVPNTPYPPTVRVVDVNPTLPEFEVPLPSHRFSDFTEYDEWYSYPSGFKTKKRKKIEEPNPYPPSLLRLTLTIKEKS